MAWVIAFLVSSVVVQVTIFIFSKRYKAKAVKDDVLIKYNINSRSQLFSVLCRLDIPQEDKQKLNDIYKETAS